LVTELPELGIEIVETLYTTDNKLSAKEHITYIKENYENDSRIDSMAVKNK
jgi:hypothetical protein